MTRAISENEFVAAAPKILGNVTVDSILIQRDGRTIAALISAEEFEIVRRARAKRAIEALEAMGRHIQSVATPAEIDELEKALDRKAS